jgi:replicative DNA helicase
MTQNPIHEPPGQGADLEAEGRHLRAVNPNEPPPNDRHPSASDGAEQHPGRYSIRGEQYVLGAVMASHGHALADLDGLTAADFYRPTHEALFTLMLAMHARGEPLELTAVYEQLATHPIRGLTGADLHEIHQACMTPANVGYYARTVRQLSRLRRIRLAGAQLVHLADAAAPGNVDTLAEQARSEVDAATRDASGGESSPLGELLIEAMERWDTKDDGFVPTGLHDLDRMLSGGLRPGHLMIIGARPAVGKSVVASIIAQSAAARGVGTVFASLEMSRGEVVDRISANVGSVDLSRLTERNLDNADWDKVAQAHHRIADWPLRILDRAEMTVAQLHARARDAGRAPQGLGLLVVDYLQLVRPADPKAQRQEQVASISRALKLLAKDLDVPVVALAQVNRGPMTRTDKRPMMSDLRESGGIEADADEIILLHRDDKESPGEIEFIVEKNRHGRTGTVAMAWSPHYSRVSSMHRGGAQ